MIWEPIKEKLDMQVLLSLYMDRRQEELSREMAIEVPCLMSISYNGVSVTSYYPRNPENARFQALLNNMGAKRSDGMYSLSTEEFSRGFRDFVQQLVKIKSVVLGTHHIADGVTNLSFRFHSSDKKEVSNLLMASAETLDYIKINYFGRTIGVKHPYHTGLRGFEMQILSLNTIPPVSELSQQSNPMGNDWRREVRYRNTDGTLDCIYYLDGNPSNTGSFDVIDAGEHIYRCVTENDMMLYMWNAGETRGLYHSRSFQSLSGGRFDIELVFPSSLNYDMISTVNSVKKRFPDWEINVESLTPLNGDTFNPQGRN
ncbi:MAG: hypothetical protein M1148_03650 [Candidatus Thermoplasmatota archaeon]|nr:hypothetical protein [Candidatus Thermoplasmatota archaeon]MCL5438273.1 hypothetical protein [Candidatus Thermoplasmatota archaeon]